MTMTKTELESRLKNFLQQFGNYEQWMNEPNPAFNGSTPQQLLDSDNLKPLEEMLFRIESGMPG